MASNASPDSRRSVEELPEMLRGFESGALLSHRSALSRAALTTAFLLGTSACQVSNDSDHDTGTVDTQVTDSNQETDTDKVSDSAEDSGDDSGLDSGLETGMDIDTDTDFDSDSDSDTDIMPATCNLYDPRPELSLTQPNPQMLLGNMEYVPLFNNYDVLLPNRGIRTPLGVIRYDANEAPIIYGAGLNTPTTNKHTPVVDIHGNEIGAISDFILDENGDGISTIPIGTADIDGDWVDEIFSPNGYYKKDGNAWHFHHFVNTLADQGCTLGIEMAIFHDYDTDGDIDIIAASPVNNYTCSALTGPAFVLEQVSPGVFETNYNTFNDSIRPQVAQHLQAKSGMLLQTQIGGQIIIAFAGETYAPGFTEEQIWALGWGNSGMYYLEGQGSSRIFEARNPLEPNAFTRQRWDYRSMAADMGVQNAQSIDEQALLTEFANRLGIPFSTLMTLSIDELIEPINAELALIGKCIEDYVFPDPNLNIDSFTPMGIASADFDRDGVLEFGLSITLSTDLSPYNTQKHFEFDLGDAYLLRDRTEDLSLHMPADRWSPQADGYNEAATLQGGLPYKHYGWGIYMAADLNNDGFDDVESVNGRDYGEHSLSYVQRRFPFEMFLSTGETLPGKKTPAVVRVTDQVFAAELPPYSPTDSSWDEYLRDGVSLCVIDLDENGRLDWLIGTDFNKSGFAGYSDGKDPVLILDNADASQNFTVSLNITSADYWVVAHYENSPSVMRQSIPYDSEGVFCHSNLMFGPSPSGELPNQIEVLDLAGNQVATLNNPATGRLHKINVTP